MKFPPYYGTSMLIADLTRVQHGIRTWDSLIQSMSLQPIFKGLFYYYLVVYDQVSQLVPSLHIHQLNFMHLSCPMHAIFPANLMLFHLFTLTAIRAACHHNDWEAANRASLFHMTTVSDLGSVKPSITLTTYSSKIYFNGEVPSQKDVYFYK
jgi:hypothetical protein